MYTSDAAPLFRYEKHRHHVGAVESFLECRKKTHLPDPVS